jgi:hypothetical protein
MVKLGQLSLTSRQRKRLFTTRPHFDSLAGGRNCIKLDPFFFPTGRSVPPIVLNIFERMRRENRWYGACTFQHSKNFLEGGYPDAYRRSNDDECRSYRF